MSPTVVNSVCQNSQVIYFDLSRQSFKGLSKVRHSLIGNTDSIDNSL